MRTVSRLLLGVVAAVFILSASGCGKSEEDKPATTAEKIGGAVENAGEKAGEVMEKAGETMKEAGDAVKEAAKEGADKIVEEKK